MAKELNWTPVLKGGVYCSSACGGGKGICDKSKYDLAVKSADALAKRMGRGWKAHVWENLGWHWEVVKGNPISSSVGFLEITPPYTPNGKYTAWIQSYPQFIAEDKNPKTALSFAIGAFDKYLAQLNKARKLVDKA